MSCDGGPVSPKFGNGIAGGSSGTAPVSPPNPNSPDTNKPFVRIDTPAVVGQLINVGDSILTVTRIIDDRQLQSLVVTGFKFTGSAILGTLTQTIRYTPVTAPVAGGAPFRAGLTDTLIRRYLQPALPLDTLIDSLVIMAIVTDAAGNVDTARKRVNIVTGPKVTIEAPAPNDSVSQGVAMLVRVHVTHPDGVASDTTRVRGEATWPAIARLDTTIVTTFTGTQRDVVISSAVQIPDSAPVKGRITITSTAIDVNRNPGTTSPVVVFVRQRGTTIPRVVDTVPPRLEITDSIIVTANGDGIDSVGFIIRDSLGAELKRAIFKVPVVTSNVSEKVPIAVHDSLQGRRVQISGFAVDQNGIRGYSIKPTLAGAQSDSNLAFRDSSLIVFGHTRPLQRPGTIGDVEVDAARGHVFLSNLDNNRLELWQDATASWYAPGIPVGSAPWGIQRTARTALAAAPSANDSLLVSNSGGTNISKVFIGTADPTQMKEDLPNRIRTRTAPLFEVREVLDAATSKISIGISTPLLFSNRPQYVGQNDTGLTFFSTKPTTEAPKGMIHWFRPKHPFPDLHSIVNFKVSPTTPNFLVLNADSILVRPATATSGAPDTVVVFDHLPDTNLVSDSARSPGGLRPCFPANTPEPCAHAKDLTVGIGTAVARLKLGWNGSCDPIAAPPAPAPQFSTACDSSGKAFCNDAGGSPPSPHCSDIELIPRVDIASIGYTDTSFVATSGDRKWVAFGSANTVGAGVIFMAGPAALPANRRFPADTFPFFSSVFSQTDLTNNAAEHVHGLALDSSGTMVAAHGIESSFASVDEPFHLRLQGKFNTFSSGAGIAFHPRANGASTPGPTERLAFVASDNASVAILDVAHFLSAGTLPVKTKLIGPLRVSLPFPTDPPDVVLKLVGLASTGLVIIDVRAANLTPIP
jgi:hypothetical protein